MQSDITPFRMKGTPDELFKYLPIDRLDVLQRREFKITRPQDFADALEGMHILDEEEHPSIVNPIGSSFYHMEMDPRTGLPAPDHREQVLKPWLVTRGDYKPEYQSILIKSIAAFHHKKISCCNVGNRTKYRLDLRANRHDHALEGKSRSLLRDKTIARRRCWRPSSGQTADFHGAMHAAIQRGRADGPSGAGLGSRWSPRSQRRSIHRHRARPAVQPKLRDERGRFRVFRLAAAFVDIAAGQSHRS